MGVLNNADFGRFDVEDMEVNEHRDGTIHVTANVVDVESNTKDEFMSSKPVSDIMREKEVIGIRGGKFRFRFL
jgi:hypothetical protein